MNYEFAYRVGFHPWEDAEDQPEFLTSLTRLVEAEENGQGAPYGRALDLGTGSAIWAIYLAKRGWQVSGVDIVDKALERASERVRKARVEVELVRGDVTALHEAGLRPGFRLLLDTGTFHGLSANEREAMGRTATSLAAEDATILL